MAFFTMVGVCLHFGYHLVRPNDEASAKNGLASSVTTAIFLVNWIGIKCSADGVHYFSAGILSGACAVTSFTRVSTNCSTSPTAWCALI